MKSVMTYKGYRARIDYDDDVITFFGKVINTTRDAITFQGDTIPELQQAFADSVEEYLRFCAQRQVKPEKPLSGQILIRVPPELHEKLVIEAHEKDLSLNKYLNMVLERGCPDL
jgi:predicted HicB family RNase H-like nuclease